MTPPSSKVPWIKIAALMLLFLILSSPSLGIIAIPVVTTEDTFSPYTVALTQREKGVLLSSSPQEILGRTYYDPRTLAKKLFDRIVSLARSTADTLYKMPSIVKTSLGFANPHYVDPLQTTPGWKEQSDGLYVMVHGLNGHPSAFDDYGKTLENRHPEADLAIVVVPKGGNCTVIEASEPILQLVESYIKKNPEKPVSLIGTSNGGRIVAYIETKLRKRAPNTPVLVSCVAGAHFGSYVMNLIHAYGLADLFGYTREIMQELAYGSDVTKNLLNEQREPLPNGVERDFSFYMTTEETHVHPPNSELPIINQGEKHYVVHGEGHSSIVRRVLPNLLEHATEWMKARS